MNREDTACGSRSAGPHSVMSKSAPAPTNEMAGQATIRTLKLTAVKFHSQLGYMGRPSSNSGKTAMMSMTENRKEQ